MNTDGHRLMAIELQRRGLKECPAGGICDYLCSSVANVQASHRPQTGGCASRLMADDATLAAADGVYPHEELTGQVIAAAYEVHRTLGHGFLEKVYENALVIELQRRGLRATQQAEIAVAYKGEPVGTYYADVLVDDVVICEVKAVEAINSAHQAQLLNYLKATRIKVGLIINFGRRVSVKRMVF
jgi:GxxExxY protein